MDSERGEEDDASIGGLEQRTTFNAGREYTRDDPYENEYDQSNESVQESDDEDENEIIGLEAAPLVEDIGPFDQRIYGSVFLTPGVTYDLFVLLHSLSYAPEAFAVPFVQNLLHWLAQAAQVSLITKEHKRPIMMKNPPLTEVEEIIAHALAGQLGSRSST